MGSTLVSQLDGSRARPVRKAACALQHSCGITRTPWTPAPGLPRPPRVAAALPAPPCAQRARTSQAEGPKDQRREPTWVQARGGTGAGACGLHPACHGYRPLASKPRVWCVLYSLVQAARERLVVLHRRHIRIAPARLAACNRVQLTARSQLQRRQGAARPPALPPRAKQALCLGGAPVPLHACGRSTGQAGSAPAGPPASQRPTRGEVQVNSCLQIVASGFEHRQRGRLQRRRQQAGHPLVTPHRNRAAAERPAGTGKLAMRLRSRRRQEAAGCIRRSRGRGREREWALQGLRVAMQPASGRTSSAPVIATKLATASLGSMAVAPRLSIVDTHEHGSQRGGPRRRSGPVPSGPAAVV